MTIPHMTMSKRFFFRLRHVIFGRIFLGPKSLRLKHGRVCFTTKGCWVGLVDFLFLLGINGTIMKYMKYTIYSNILFSMLLVDPEHPGKYQLYRKHKKTNVKSINQFKSTVPSHLHDVFLKLGIISPIFGVEMTKQNWNQQVNQDAKTCWNPSLDLIGSPYGQNKQAFSLQNFVEHSSQQSSSKRKNVKLLPVFDSLGIHSPSENGNGT